MTRSEAPGEGGAARGVSRGWRWPAFAGVLALAGAVVWGLGEWSLRDEEVVGANIGAGLLLLLSWALFGLAALTALVAVVVRLSQR